MYSKSVEKLQAIFKNYKHNFFCHTCRVNYLKKQVKTWHTYRLMKELIVLAKGYKAKNQTCETSMIEIL